MKIYKQVTTKEAVDVESGVMHYAVTKETESCGNRSEKIVALFELESGAKLFVSKMNNHYDTPGNVWYNVRQLAERPFLTPRGDHTYDPK